MTLNRATEIISKSHPEFKPVSVVDYKGYFVFDIAPKNYDPETNGEWTGELIAVDKMFEVTMHFIPMLHDPDAYARAVETNITYF